MKISKRSVRALLPRFLMFAGLLAVALAFTGAPATSASPDFSMSISPSSQTGGVNSPVYYTVTVTALNGFTGTVLLSVQVTYNDCLPALNPRSISGSGTSQLEVVACRRLGLHAIKVTGTSGSLQHYTEAFLNAQ